VTEKTILWLGSSRSDLQAFPQDARRLAGFQLRLIQQGLEPFDWKPMASIGPGVREIRIHTAVEHRICYVVNSQTRYMFFMSSRNGQEKLRSAMCVSPDNGIRPWLRAVGSELTQTRGEP
jgi:hypothetical protein